MISCDCREPEHVKDMLLQAVGAEQVRIDRLRTADFVFVDVCEHTVGVERKTASDFLNSFASGRLRDQLGRLVQEFHVPVLLIEGNFGLSEDGYVRVQGAKTGWRYGAIQMALFKMQGSGIRVLHTGDLRGTADTLRVLHARGLPPQPKCLQADLAGSYLDGEDKAAPWSPLTARKPPPSRDSKQPPKMVV